MTPQKSSAVGEFSPVKSPETVKKAPKSSQVMPASDGFNDELTPEHLRSSAKTAGMRHADEENQGEKSPQEEAKQIYSYIYIQITNN